MYNLIHQKYLNIVNCEIVTVKSDEKKKKSQMHLNTVASKILFNFIIDKNIY